MSIQADAQPHLSLSGALEAGIPGFFCRGLQILTESRIPFLVGGAYAFQYYTGIERHTKDLDVFVRPGDCNRTLEVLSMAGCRTELTFPHWLGKAFYGEEYIDVIFNSGNGIAEVDDGWFEHALAGEILSQPVWLCPLEETIWSKAFVMERERYDGADIAHLIHACGTRLDWDRLVPRFGPHWPVLLSHLILFGFIYPPKRGHVPDWVMQELLERLQRERRNHSREPMCHGTLLSRAEYLVDVERWGYHDARRLPKGNMTTEEIAQWTAAMEEGQTGDANRAGEGATDRDR